MDVALGLVGQFEVDDVADAVHVETARGDVGGNQHAHLAVAKSGERVLASVLALVTVDGVGRYPGRIEVAHDSVGAGLGACEDDGAGQGRIAQDFAQQRAFVGLANEVHRLRNRVHGRGRGRDGNLGGVAQDLASQGGDGGRHGGREKQVLPLGRQLGDDAADGIDESHVEHTVGLVEHQGLDVGKRHAALAHEIEQAAGSGYQDVDATAQGRDLRALRDAAQDHAVVERDVLAVHAEAVRDLHGQFTRGRQHEHARAHAALGLAGIGHAVQERQREGRGLTGSRLGAAEQVASLHDERNGLYLDGRGRGVAFSRDGAKNGNAQAKSCEGACLGQGRNGVRGTVGGNRGRNWA